MIGRTMGEGCSSGEMPCARENLRELVRDLSRLDQELDSKLEERSYDSGDESE